MSAPEHLRTWTIARHRLGVDIPATVFLWVLFAVGVVVLCGVVALVTTVRISAWEQAAQIPRWFAGGTGVYLTYFHLPLYVAHGFTRREFATQVPVVIAAFGAVLAALMTIGYVIETFVYRVAGWSQALTRAHLFDSPDQVHVVFAEFWLVFLVWTVGGALLGAGFYRNGGLGLLLIPVGLLMAGVVEYALGDGLGPMPFGFLRLLLRPLEGIDASSVTGAAAICAGVVAVGAATTWAVIRDVPVHNKPA
jgi:hypothetical protein